MTMFLKLLIYNMETIDGCRGSSIFFKKKALEQE